MPDILQALPIGAPVERVYQAITAPAGLNEWYTLRSTGDAREGEEYTLYFGPEYDWRARVTRAVSPAEFELEFTSADDDWRGTRLGFHLQPRDAGGTWLEFRHTGWPEANDHYRISAHCWAMYLRVLRRFLEHGERVPYDQRLDV